MNAIIDTQQKIAELMAGAIYDTEQFDVAEMTVVQDTLERYHYTLRVYPEYHLVAAIPDSTIH